METHSRTADAASPRAPGAPEAGEGAERSVREGGVWIFDGIAVGVMGAAVIAVFFLVVDLAEGRPFWTPAALGSEVFRGESLPPEAAPAPVLVVGYTALHGFVFVTVGLMASFALLGNRARLGRFAALGLAGGLFAGLEVFFLTFLGLMAPGLIPEFGLGRIAAANLLAALAMSAGLLLRRPESQPTAASA